MSTRAVVKANSQHTHTFNGPLSGTTRVSRYQKGKTNLDFTEARDSEWLGRVQVCTSLQTDNHASTPPLWFFTDRMPFLPPNQQRQSTEAIAVGHPMTKMLSASGGLCPLTPLGALPPDTGYRLVLRTRHGAPPQPLTPSAAYAVH